MSKLVVYYCGADKSSKLDCVLKIKVDDNDLVELRMKDKVVFDLEEGSHRVKAYFTGWNKNDVCGFINSDIVLDGDSYYMYKVPLLLSKPGKLIKVNGEEDFRKYESRRVILNILSVIGVLLAAVIIGMFC